MVMLIGQLTGYLSVPSTRIFPLFLLEVDLSFAIRDWFLSKGGNQGPYRMLATQVRLSGTDQSVGHLKFGGLLFYHQKDDGVGQK